MVGGEALRTTGIAVAGPGPALPEVSAAGYVVADLDTGQVLAAKDPHGRYAPASTLKTLTALTLLPRLDPQTSVTPVREDVDVDGSKVGLVPELAYPVRELTTALLLSSGNDAAGALATAVGGMPRAAELLNAEAARLQARDTHAVNTSGLDAPGQVSSAYDLALIARAGMALPEFREQVRLRRASIAAPGGRRIQFANHNRLLDEYPGALGIKNGFTSAARASFVGAASRDSRTLVVTLLRADPSVWREAGRLLDWGFAAAAAGARPVGQLVEPLSPAPQRAPTGAAPAVAPAAAVVEDDGGWGREAAGVLGLAAGALVLRRRQVVLRRRRRRAAMRRAARPAGTVGGAGALGAGSSTPGRAPARVAARRGRPSRTPGSAAGTRRGVVLPYPEPDVRAEDRDDGRRSSARTARRA